MLSELGLSSLLICLTFTQENAQNIDYRQFGKRNENEPKPLSIGYKASAEPYCHAGEIGEEQSRKPFAAFKFHFTGFHCLEDMVIPRD